MVDKDVLRTEGVRAVRFPLILPLIRLLPDVVISAIMEIVDALLRWIGKARNAGSLLRDSDMPDTKIAGLIRFVRPGLEGGRPGIAMTTRWNGRTKSGKCNRVQTYISRGRQPLGN